MIETSKYDKGLEEWQYEIKMDVKHFEKLRTEYLKEYKELCDQLPKEGKTKYEQASIFNTMLKFWYDKLPDVTGQSIRHMNPYKTARYYLCSSTINEMIPKMMMRLQDFDDKENPIKPIEIKPE